MLCQTEYTVQSKAKELDTFSDNQFQNHGQYIHGPESHAIH